MNSNECYELLGVEIGYDGDDFEDVINQAFEDKTRELQKQVNNGEITEDVYLENYTKLCDAREALIDSKVSALGGAPVGGQSAVGQTGATVAKKTKSKSGKGVKCVVGAIAVAAVIGISGLVGYHFGLDKSNADVTNNIGIETEYNQTTPGTTEAPVETQTPSVTEAPENKEETLGATEATEETQEQKQSEGTKETVMVVNYGDVSDQNLVTQRATTVATQLEDAGVINMNTGLPYTVEEIEKISMIMCGAYIPEVEGEAYAIVNDYLNFCLMDTDLTIAFANVNGIDWSNIADPAYLEALKTTDLPNLQRLQQTTPKIMIVDNMLYGDVSVAAYNYLKMFEAKYQEMIYSTDQAKCDDIYLDLTYSLTRLRVNGEYTFTWNNETYTVTMNDFSGRDKINAGNILQYYVFMYQTAFSKIEEAKVNDLGNSVYAGIDDPSGDKYTYTYVPGEVHGETVEDSVHYIGYNDENISLDPSVNYADHKYLETTQYFNAICYDILSLEDIALDNEGYLFLLGDQSAQNFSTINQINTMNAALANYYNKGLDYYNHTFNKTLTK